MKITLLDGREEDAADIFFDADTYHFTLHPSGEDITEQIRRADKLAMVSGFDQDRENRRVYEERSHPGSKPLGSTSTAENFFEQITTDPLAAPLASLDAGIKKLFSSSGVKTIAVVALIGLVAFLLVRQK